MLCEINGFTTYSPDRMRPPDWLLCSEPLRRGTNSWQSTQDNFGTHVLNFALCRSYDAYTQRRRSWTVST
jgi:hypothetical protein